MDAEAKNRAREAGKALMRQWLTAPQETIDWRWPNWMTVLLMGLLLLLSQVERKSVYFGHLPHDFVIAFGATIVAGFINWNIRTYGFWINEFKPKSSLAAKRANEQIKSLATAINALAAGGAVAMTVKEMTNEPSNYGLVVFAVGLGVYIHTAARGLLGMLKDETILDDTEGSASPASVTGKVAARD